MQNYSEPKLNELYALLPEYCLKAKAENTGMLLISFVDGVHIVQNYHSFLQKK